jgi:hypothetical protein
MRILIHISALQKGFLMTLANLLSVKNKIFFIARDKNVETLLKKKLSKKNIKKIYIEENVNNNIEKDYKQINKNTLIKEAIFYEKKYGIDLSFFLGKDRALGRGYLLNVDRYPNVIRANWDKEKKIFYFLNILKNIEKIILISKPKIIFSVSRSYFISIIAKKYKIKYLTLTAARIGNRFFWCDNDSNTSLSLIKKIKYSNSLKNINKLLKKQHKFAQIIESKQLHAKIKYNLINVFFEIYLEILKEFKQFVKGSRRKFSYNLLGWVPVKVRKYFSYKYVTRNSKFPKDFKKNKIVYIPLNLEPEIALLGISPEFNNTLEMITWVSKSLPADYSIVIKEQPFAFGTRSRWFYKTLIQMPNVYLANPKIHPWDWIKNSFCVATITGSAAFEAVHFKKPVLSYGIHQIVNFLPSVKYCSNYIETKNNLKFLIKNKKKLSLDRAKKILISSIYETSFELKEYIQSYYDVKLENQSAKIAINYIDDLND